MEKKRIIVLGATGSIGTSCLDIVRQNPDLFEVVGLSAGNRARELLSLGSEFHVKNLALVHSEKNCDSSVAYTGADGLLRLITDTQADIVVNGISGAAGLAPSVATLTAGKDLALANKETMVMAGPLIKRCARTSGKQILPVDSEHSAIFRLLHNLEADGNKASEILLTASGGPFREWPTDKIQNATVHDALQHPTWNMGKKITIDSASMANKGLEVIEAVQLFDMKPESITVVVHPQSIVHSMIRMMDNVVYAQLSKPDMKHPILSAFTWPTMIQNDFEVFTFDKLRTLTFEPPRINDFKLLPLAYFAAKSAALYPTAYNAANEVAVAHFIAGHISFGNLATITDDVLSTDWSCEPTSFEEIYNADTRARLIAEESIKKCNTYDKRK